MGTPYPIALLVRSPAYWRFLGVATLRCRTGGVAGRIQPRAVHQSDQSSTAPMARRTRRRRSPGTPKIADDRDRFLRSLFRDDGSTLRERKAGPLPRPEWTPRLDPTKGGDGCRLIIDLPGGRTGDLRIRVEDEALFVEGVRHRSAAAERTTRVLLAERTYGSFPRVLRLPPAVPQSRKRASFGDGVLMVRLPMAAQRGPMHVSTE